jgi:hypothetical protein
MLGAFIGIDTCFSRQAFPFLVDISDAKPSAILLSRRDNIISALVCCAQDAPYRATNVQVISTEGVKGLHIMPIGKAAGRVASTLLHEGVL